MTIGSHTVTHPVLAALSEAGQRHELGESRDRIGEVIGRRPEMLAYPVGGPDAFTAATKRLAHEAGYRAAFSYSGGLNRSSNFDPFAIARLPVHHAETWPQFRLRVTWATIQSGLPASGSAPHRAP
jgi:peptidoglycan/xylan/chitin deacetylase (PgdA/CDA1 family)